MRLHHFSSFGLGAISLSFVVACAGGQTGDLSGRTATGEAYAGCDEHREQLPSFDTETEGGTAEELLAYAEGKLQAPLTWKTAPQGQSWSAGPESGTGRLSLKVARGAKAYRLTYTQPQSEGGAELALAAVCPPPSLGVEATVAIRTDGGALNESLPVLLRSSTPGVATLSVPLDLTKLSGSLSITSSKPQSKVVQTTLEAILAAGKTAGTITGMEQTDAGQVSSASPVVIAAWPDSEACAQVRNGLGFEAALSDDVLGATGEQTLASVSRETPAEITWKDGTASQLSVLVESTAPGCFSMGAVPTGYDQGPAVSYPIQVTLTSADGHLQGQYAGQATASLSDGERKVQVTADVEIELAHVTDSGFKDVSVPEGANRLVVSVRAERTSSSASGSVELSAVFRPPCVQNPDPGDGMSAPGCEGEKLVSLEKAAWSY